MTHACQSTSASCGSASITERPPKRSTAPAKLHHKSMDWEHKTPSRQTTPPKTREMKKSDPEGNKAKKTKTSDLEGQNTRNKKQVNQKETRKGKQK